MLDILPCHALAMHGLGASGAHKLQHALRSMEVGDAGAHHSLAHHSQIVHFSLRSMRVGDAEGAALAAQALIGGALPTRARRWRRVGSTPS